MRAPGADGMVDLTDEAVLTCGVAADQEVLGSSLPVSVAMFCAESRAESNIHLASSSLEGLSNLDHCSTCVLVTTCANSP